jgi:S-(hydroxymethyl)mycothiol dehydrogenase
LRSRAALYASADAAVAVEEIDLDEPGPGEVLVRIEAAGVCRSDLHIRDTRGWGLRFPIALGHEGAGVVEAVGDGVTEPRPGERVVLSWRAPCGTCPECVRGEPRRCRSPLRARRRMHRVADGAPVTPALTIGCFAEHAIVHAAQAIRIPEGLPPEQTCLIGCAVITGVGAVLTTSPAWPGSTVVVIGCGGVGTSAVQGARIAGAGRIVAVDVAPEKLEAARRVGATDAVHAGEADAVAAVRALTDGAGADHVYDTVGRPESLARAVAMLGYGGTATLIGIPRPDTEVTLPLDAGGRGGLFPTRATVRVCYGGDQLPAEDFPRLARLALDGQLDLASLVSRTIALDDAPAALDELTAGGVLRSVVVP